MSKKKLISIGIVVLTLVVVIIIAATTGSDNSGNSLIGGTNGNSFNGVELGSDSLPNGVTPQLEDVIMLGYSAEVTEKSLKVYSDNIFVQELKYPTDHNGKFVLGFAKNHISFLDMNFDGKEDICLTISASGGKYSYYCWIYDTEKDTFQYNKTLSELTSISLDSEKKQVISTEEKDGKKVYVIYEWKNGEFEKIETQTKAPEAVKDNVIGSTSSGSTTARPDKNQGGGSNSGLSGAIIPGATKPQGSSGGIVIATENKNDIWY